MTPAVEITVGRRLIVDDVEANRQLLERQLELPQQSAASLEGALESVLP